MGTQRVEHYDSVAIVQDTHLSPCELMEEALEKAGFWQHLDYVLEVSKRPSEAFTILIKTDLGAFAQGSPTATDPQLVEHLMDLLHERGFQHVNLCGTAASDFYWAENRDVAVLADLLGYAYVTPAGHDYDVIDLSEELTEACFGEEQLLHGSQIGRRWQEADFRVCFSSNKTDRREAYALNLKSLLGVLPLVDKDLYYRRQAGEVVSELLEKYHVHFALVDAVRSAHGNGASQAPQGLDTQTIIASANVALGDFVGALKMGLDPYSSPLADTVYKRHPLPERYAVHGSLAPYQTWHNVAATLRDSQQKSEQLPLAGRLSDPWLQQLDADRFPLKNLLDSQLNEVLGSFFAQADTDPSVRTLLTLVNYGVGLIGQWLNTYAVMQAKDQLVREEVPLGFDPSGFSPDDYQAIRPPLDQLDVLLADIEPATPALRWREVEGATVFCFARELPIPFDEFIDKVDVSRTIQFMNDYIGGALVVTARDDQGRPIHQAERNLYLPQPNYLVLYQGQNIDVSKIEICDYDTDHHRMYWKTVHSENGSATYDDGVVFFKRSERGTRVSITGKQRFTLPPFWQAVDLNLWPELKAELVTHAYATFFERTLANFEALVEGRDIRIGKRLHPAQDSFDTEPFPAQKLEQLLRELGERYGDIVGKDGDALLQSSEAAAQASYVDDEGFRHFSAPHDNTSSTPSRLALLLEPLTTFIEDYLKGLNHAMSRDLDNKGGAAQ